ncbi:MAG: A/G-specific adenine glycosylase, partial [Cyanobium sp.]
MPADVEGFQSALDSGGLAAPVPLLRKQLLDWWQVHGRRSIDQKPWMFTPDGGWPDEGEELCCLGTWVAEVMLQQTQLTVALPYWHRWMEALPNLRALATAGEQDVLLLWQGLG